MWVKLSQENTSSGLQTESIFILIYAAFFYGHGELSRPNFLPIAQNKEILLGASFED